MRFDVITLFPDLFSPFLSLGINRRAYASGLVDVQVWDLRDHAEGNYRRVDDRPFGGGPGMVMMAEPLARCLVAVRTARGEPSTTHKGGEADRAPVVLFSPIGEPMRHAVVARWAVSSGAILVCGRYEGVDQRFIDHHVDCQISLGDFVLSGGEIAALALLDAVTRLQPGVLNDAGSHQQDSFNPALDGLLDCPHYTRPEVWGAGDEQPMSVPEVLLSGDHARIAAFRRQQSLRITATHRPDVLAAVRQAGHLTPADERYLTELARKPR